MSVSTDAGPLVTAAELAAFGTFSDEVVKAAGAGVRSETGWHIAPTITETLTLDGDGSYVLMLPTLKIVEVLAVRDVSGSTPRDITSWRQSPAGFLTRRDGFWPAGASTIEVELRHGYPKCPDELLPVIAHRAQAQRATGLANVRLGSLSIGSGTGDPSSVDEAVLKRYTL